MKYFVFEYFVFFDFFWNSLLLLFELLIWCVRFLINEMKKRFYKQVEHYQTWSLISSQKVRQAELHHVGALLLYTDPVDGRDLGTNGYPETWGLPSSAMQRGGLLNVKGDPLTPGWPSKGSFLFFCILFFISHHLWFLYCEDASSYSEKRFS